VEQHQQSALPVYQPSSLLHSAAASSYPSPSAPSSSPLLPSAPVPSSGSRSAVLPPSTPHRSVSEIHQQFQTTLTRLATYARQQGSLDPAQITQFLGSLQAVQRPADDQETNNRTITERITALKLMMTQNRARSEQQQQLLIQQQLHQQQPQQQQQQQQQPSQPHLSMDFTSSHLLSSDTSAMMLVSQSSSLPSRPSSAASIHSNPSIVSAVHQPTTPLFSLQLSNPNSPISRQHNPQTSADPTITSIQSFDNSSSHSTYLATLPSTLS